MAAPATKAAAIPACVFPMRVERAPELKGVVPAVLAEPVADPAVLAAGAVEEARAEVALTLTLAEGEAEAEAEPLLLLALAVLDTEVKFFFLGEWILD